MTRNIMLFMIIVMLAVILLFTGSTYFRSVKTERASWPWTANDEINYIDTLIAKGLNGPAALEMERYIGNYRGRRKELAKVCYRLGTIYMNLYKYEKALQYFYRADMLDKKAGFSEDMNRKIVEALDNLGMDAQAKYELEARTTLGVVNSPKGKIVASIGERKIDENEIDRALNSLPENVKDKLKEPKERRIFIRQYVTTEALYNKALRVGIDKIPDVRAFIDNTKKQIVVQKMLEKEVAKKLVVDVSDVKLYYEANKDEYAEKAKVKVRFVELPQKANDDEAIKNLKNGKGESEWVYEGNVSVGNIGKAEDVVKELLKKSKGDIFGPVNIKNKSYIFIVDKNKPRYQKPFDEVKNDVEYEYKMKKKKRIVDSIIKNVIQDEGVEIFNEPVAKSNKAD